MSVALRPVSNDDGDILFEFMSDPESVWMAAFTSEAQSDRAAFDDWTARLRGAPGVRRRTVVSEGRVVGSIGSFEVDGSTEVTYWIGRAFWGRGIASEALMIFLGELVVRPIRARAASDNLRSIRVLKKAGFRAIGTEVSFAAARDRPIEETIFELGAAT